MTRSRDPRLVRDVAITAPAWSPALALMIDGIFRDIRKILNGGFRFRDQAVLRTFRWNTSAAPVRVTVPGDRPPLGLLLVRAVYPPPAPIPRVASGGTVEWFWDGKACAVESITGLAPATAYDVTLLVVED